MSSAGSGLGRNINTALVVVESLIALVIIIIIAAGVYASVLLFASSVRQQNFSIIHTALLNMVDLVIIMLLAADLLRTIVVSVREGRVPIRGIAEVAMIVIVREMVATSLEGFSVAVMATLAGSFLAVAAAYSLIRRYANE